MLISMMLMSNGTPLLMSSEYALLLPAVLRFVCL
jgi:hypothetical protein